jgi:hypothetical protein
VTRDPAITDEILAKLARRHRRERRRHEAFVKHLGKDYPESRARAEGSAYGLLRGTWTRPQIRKFVAAYDTDDMLFPGILDTPGEISFSEFMACVGILAKGEYARTRPRKEMLSLLAAADALRGATVIEGASRGGQMRAAARSTVARDEKMAAEFKRRRSQTGMSDSALKEAIGKDNGLGRTASIDGINRGLKKPSG